MKFVVIGAHLRRDDVEPLAEPLAAGPLWLSAISVEDDQPLGDRDLLLRVARVRAELLGKATFVAIRYGFAARSETEAAAKCAQHLERWKQLLEAHRDEVEMTLKVAATGGKPRPQRAGFTSGAAYLKALHEATRSADIEPPFRAAVDERFGPVASTLRWIHRDNSSVELAALVSRTRIDEIVRAGELLRHDFPRVPFLLSGPWPLEVFADADYE